MEKVFGSSVTVDTTVTTPTFTCLDSSIGVLPFAITGQSEVRPIILFFHSSIPPATPLSLICSCGCPRGVQTWAPALPRLSLAPCTVGVLPASPFTGRSCRGHHTSFGSAEKWHLMKWRKGITLLLNSYEIWPGSWLQSRAVGQTFWYVFGHLDKHGIWLVGCFFPVGL